MPAITLMLKCTLPDTAYFTLNTGGIMLKNPNYPELSGRGVTNTIGGLRASNRTKQKQQSQAAGSTGVEIGTLKGSFRP